MFNWKKLNIQYLYSVFSAILYENLVDIFDKFKADKDYYIIYLIIVSYKFYAQHNLNRRK
jgi:hypothetical protein